MEKAQQRHQSRRYKYESFLKSVNCCPLCSSPLILIHEINGQDHRIKETAHCDICEVQTRQKNHTCH